MSATCTDCITLIEHELDGAPTMTNYRYQRTRTLTDLDEIILDIWTTRLDRHSIALCELALRACDVEEAQMWLDGIATIETVA